MTLIEVTLLVAVLFFTGWATVASTEANWLTRKSFVADQRHWMLIEFIEANSPLVWDNNEGRISFQFMAKNVGKTPAIDVARSTDVLIGPDPDMKILEGGRIARRRPYGQIVFPDKIFPQSTRMGIQRNVIEETLKRSHPDPKIDDWPLLLILQGNIQYSHTLEKREHVTEFMFRIVKKRDGKKEPIFFCQDVEKECLLVQRWPFKNLTVT